MSHTCQLKYLLYLHWTWLSIQCKYRSPNLTVYHALRICWEVCMFLKNRCKIMVVPTPASAALHRWAPQKIQDMEKERCLSLWHKCFDVWRWWTLFRKAWYPICHGMTSIVSIDCDMNSFQWNKIQFIESFTRFDENHSSRCMILSAGSLNFVFEKLIWYFLPQNW